MAEKRGISLYLNDIYDSIKKIEIYISDVSEKEFIANFEKQDAVVRRLEIIGEAVKKIPEYIRAKYHEVPWKEIAGLRDIVIHEYFGVSAPLIFKTVKSDLPALKETIEKMLLDLT